jgi:predicted transposase/invertase (TIGR01784 family)
MKFLDPKNDLAFKKIFGNENKKEILISFLNSVLDFKGLQTITDVNLNNPYQLPDIEDLKETILDIKATNQNGEQFIVEMQRKDLHDFDKRSLYYTSKAYVSQSKKGDSLIDLKRVYYIAILNFNMFENKNYISRHLIINQETMTQDLKDFEFTFIELKKFNVELEDLDTIIDKWIYFINNASSLDLIPKEYENMSAFKEAFLIANSFSWSDKELEYYDSMMMRKWDDENAMETAIRKGVKRGLEKGMKQGLEQGIQKGIEKGIEQGIEKGIEKGKEQEKINLAKNLLDVLDDETISLKIGLSVEHIKSLRVNNH